jgi:CheY-like chemotaxis protein
MTGDLLSLRMLLVGAPSSDQTVWRKGAALASVPIEFDVADAGPAACKTLGKGGVDICIIDSRLAAGEMTEVLQAARALVPSPFVVLSGPDRKARLEGSDGALLKPSGEEDARKLVEICIRMKVPTRVLIVDDSSTIRSIVRKILSASRFAMQCHEAEEGAAALERLSNGNFGMVFLDYNMPGLNGVETLSEIKRKTPNVAVVMMTSKFDDRLAARARAAGALAFLKKPFFPSDIDTVLAHYYGVSPPPP